MKVKIIKVNRLPEDDLGRRDPEVTIELPSGEQLQVHLYDHSNGSISPQRARKRVLQEIAWEMLRHDRRNALCDAVEALGAEIDVDLDQDDS